MAGFPAGKRCTQCNSRMRALRISEWVRRVSAPSAREGPPDFYPSARARAREGKKSCDLIGGFAGFRQLRRCGHGRPVQIDLALLVDKAPQESLALRVVARRRQQLCFAALRDVVMNEIAHYANERVIDRISEALGDGGHRMVFPFLEIGVGVHAAPGEEGLRAP